MARTTFNGSQYSIEHADRRDVGAAAYMIELIRRPVTQ